MDATTEMTEAEYAELIELRDAFREIFRKDPEGVTQAIKDMVQLPSFTGTL